MSDPLPDAGDITTEIALEQRALDAMYARLDALREAIRTRRAIALRAETGDSPTALAERDARITHDERQLASLERVDDRLCFGRIDLRDGSRHYIGRIGLADEDNEPLLVDWRAPAAAAFYQATAAVPGDVVRRRHLTTHGRRIVAVEDEVLDLAAIDAGERRHLVGEGALMAAVQAPRTGRMGDIVATIQAEQDRIIRADRRGVLVVQGGPGTGKTVVALHRTAYLLYTHRDKLAHSGVLVVGPSPVFLRYIERVLPSLGETGVVMRTPGTLFPGVRTERDDAPDVARVKGDLRMVEVLRRAIRRHQRVPDATLELVVHGTTIAVAPEAFRAARRRARDSGAPHNAARPVFVRHLYDHLVGLLAGPLAPGERIDAEARADLLDDLLTSEDVREAVRQAWPPLVAQDVVGALLTDADLLERAGRDLEAAERRALWRDPADADRWTVADVPLLDEAAEMLGVDESAVRAAARQAAAQRAADVEYARNALQLTGGYAAALVSAEALAERFGERGDDRTVAERAGHDRGWAFGHVVVDEAQELSPMAWRLIVRRCPSRSMTLVGDIAQTGSAAGADAWADVVAPYAADRWRLAELTMNYRTPAAVMDVAAAVVRAAGIAVTPPTSVRPGEPPAFVRLGAADERGSIDAAGAGAPGADDALAALVDVVRAEHAALGGGRMAVIAPSAGPFAAEPLAARLAAALPPDAVGHGADAIDAPVAVLDPRHSKGLEVDVAVVVAPSAIAAAPPRGVNDLYVALTRPTRRLVVAYAAPLPAGLAEAAGAAGAERAAEVRD